MRTPRATGLRALVLGRSLLNGGAEKQSILLTRALRELGSAELVCLYDQADERMMRLALAQGVEPEFLRGSLPRKLWWLVRHVQDRDITLVLATLPVTNVVAAVVSILGGCDAVGGCRTSWDPRRGRLLASRVLHRFVFRGTYANSETGRQFLIANGFAGQRVVVLPNAMEPASQGHRPPGANAPLRLITVARMVPVKDYRLAMQVFARVRAAAAKEGREVAYEIVGYGPEAGRVEALIDELDVRGSVRIHDRNVDILKTLGNADIYLSTSRQDGMPNAIMEAMGVGLPFVATPAGDVTVLAGEQSAGFVSTDRDPDELADLVLRLVRNEGLRKRMGSSARCIIARDYSMEGLRCRLEEALLELNLYTPDEHGSFRE